VLDGWWAEAYDGRAGHKNGWGISSTVDMNDADRNHQDAETLYEILQDEVIPLYYDRGDGLGYSQEWVQLCKRSMASVLPHFNSERVLRDYLQNFYVPAAKHGRAIAADGHRVARQLAEWKAKVRAQWPGVALKQVRPAARAVTVNDTVSLEVEVTLNGLTPEDVRVECVVHRVLGSELAVPLKRYAESRRPQLGVSYVEGETVLRAVLEPVTRDAASVCSYRLEFQPPWAGSLAYEIRAVPQHPHLTHAYELGLMRKL
jgi:starch phosphorylase